MVSIVNKSKFSAPLVDFLLASYDGEENMMKKQKVPESFETKAAVHIVMAYCKAGLDTSSMLPAERK